MDNPAKTLKHWLVLAVACGISASSVGITMNVIGVFYTPVSQDLGIYRGTFAMHATLASLALAVISLFFTPLLYRFGWKKVLISGVMLASFSTMAMAFTTQIWIFNLLGLLRGVGAGLYSMIPLSMIVNNWFEEKKGLAMSLSFGSTGIAGAIFSPIFTTLINTIGWESSFIAMGITMILLALPAILYRYELNPKDEGLLPYGYTENGSVTHQTSERSDPKNFSYKRAAFLIISFIALTHTSITGISQHLPGYAESNELSIQVGGYLLSAVMIGNITFKLIIGSLSDWLGIIKSSVIMLMLNALSIVMLLTLSNPYVLIFSAIAFTLGLVFIAINIPLLFLAQKHSLT